MAKASDCPVVQCIEQRDYKGGDGKVRYSYVFQLEGEEFELPESRYFKPEVNKWYRPIIGVIQRAQVSKRTGNPYISRYPGVIGWEEAK